MNKKTNKFNIVLLLTIFSFSSPRIALSDWPLSVRQLSMGYTAIGHSSDPLLVFSNPSALCLIDRWCVSSSYARPYQIQELDITAAGVGWKWERFTFGLAGSYFGFKLYKQQKDAFAVAMPIGNQLYVGIGVRYHQITIKNYGQSGSLAFDAGWQYNITENTTVMGAIQNAFRTTIGQEKEPLPQILRTGFRFSPVSKITVSAEIYKDIEFQPEFRFGMELFATELLQIRAGFSRNPTRFTGGFGLSPFGFGIHYGFNYHKHLGYTHALGFVYPY